MRSNKFRRDGSPYPEGDAGLFEWAHDIEDTSKKIVEQTQVGPYLVSTIWLGLDYSFLHQGPPVIFETMIFLGDRGLGDLTQDYCERYSTEAEAREGHKYACELYQRKWESGDHHLSEEEEA